MVYRVNVDGTIKRISENTEDPVERIAISIARRQENEFGTIIEAPNFKMTYVNENES